MANWVRAGVVAALAVGAPAVVVAQSSPFSGISGWFGGRGDADGPVALDVQVKGGDDDLRRAVRSTSLIGLALDEGRVTGQDVLAAARGDYARILGALYDAGYYGGTINIMLDGTEAAAVAPLDAPAEIAQVVIAVDPGPRFTFGRAAIAPVARAGDVPAGFAQGQTAGTGAIRGAATAVVDGWRQVGHAKADVAAQNIVANHPARSVEADIAINPGPAVRFGALRAQGNERLRSERLHKIAGLDSGTRFDPDHIDTVRKRLRRSGVFSAITLTEAERLNPDNSMDIELTVVEQKTRRIGAGFEISNTDGAMVSAYWMHRNLMGGAERLRLDAKVSDISSNTSDIDTNLSARLERPATFGPDVTAFLALGAERLREPDYDSDSAKAGFGVNYIRNDRVSGAMAIQYEFSRVTDDNGTTNFRVLAFPVNATYDMRDQPNDARAGYYSSVDLTPFYGFGDTGSGGQLKGEGRAFHSFGADKAVTLAGRASIGTIFGAAIAETPRDYLFYSGGGGSVRGHPFRSLGVEVIQGPNGPIRTGAMSMATINAELRWQARERIGVVAFADAGQVWTEGAWQGDTANHVGAGLGIRYATPIGPLRFDVAGPVSGDTGDGVQLYLGLGQAF